jgi:hypothetical protein
LAGERFGDCFLTGFFAGDRLTGLRAGDCFLTGERLAGLRAGDLLAFLRGRPTALFTGDVDAERDNDLLKEGEDDLDRYGEGDLDIDLERSRFIGSLYMVLDLAIGFV